MKNYKSETLNRYIKSFDNLNQILYKTVSVNGLNFRILGIHYMDYRIDWFVPLHKHSFYELHYVIQGDAETHMQQSVFTIPENHLYLIPPGTSHAHTQKPGTGHRGFALRWEFVDSAPGSIYPFGDALRVLEAFKTASFLPFEDLYSIFDVFTELLSRASDLSSTCELALQLSFFNILLKLAGVFQSHEFQSPVKTNKAFINDNLINCTLAFLEDNYSFPLKAEDVAKSMNVSYSHLARLFKKHQGISLFDKLMQIRLEKVKEHLLFTDAKLSEIAEQTGFGNQYYLTNCFKKYYRISPGKFRELNKSTIMQ